ncbi:hypothetical protein ACODM8_01490 [Vibrio ostreicida]|uniref:hypothetical protein n=1 Tax=Vibrio ostreicida TaxID=526588 RepID=UPI003B5B4E19
MLTVHLEEAKCSLKTSPAQTTKALKNTQSLPQPIPLDFPAGLKHKLQVNDECRFFTPFQPPTSLDPTGQSMASLLV